MSLLRCSQAAALAVRRSLVSVAGHSSALRPACARVLSPCVLAAPVRSLAVGVDFERRAHTGELLDFARAREDVPRWRKQLLYRSRQRGWLELDLIMGTWADENLQKLSLEELEQYAHVVACENPDLIKCFVENMPLPRHLEGNAVAERLRHYAQLQKKQWTVQTGNQ